MDREKETLHRIIRLLGANPETGLIHELPGEIPEKKIRQAREIAVSRFQYLDGQWEDED